MSAESAVQTRGPLCNCKDLRHSELLFHAFASCLCGPYLIEYIQLSKNCKVVFALKVGPDPAQLKDAAHSSDFSTGHDPQTATTRDICLLASLEPSNARD